MRSLIVLLLVWIVALFLAGASLARPGAIWDIKDDTHFEQIVLQALGEITVVGDPCDTGRR